MKTLTADDGTEYIVFIEKNPGDEFATVNYLGPNGGGAYTNFRSAHDKASSAIAEYDRADAKMVEDRIAFLEVNAGVISADVKV